MKTTLQKQLIKDFPHIFTHDQPTTSTIPHDGITCCSGWYNIIHNLCTRITSVLDNENNEYTRHDIQCTQVKEKEGELRFYLHYASGKKRSEAIAQIYSEAQEESLKTCEQCGAG